MAKEKLQKSMEAALWDACNKMRGSIEPSEYKHVMLSLIFLKYANDKFDEQRERLIADGKQAFLEMLPFYQKDNVFFIPECARWSYLMKEAKQDDIPIKVDTALSEIEKKNPSLAGALPDNYYSRLGLDSKVLGSLLDKMNQIDLKSENDKDVFGKIYEYFLAHFALQEGKGKGEYFTPKTVVSFLCDLIQPYKGIVYDGASGSGGMFVQSAKFIEEHKGNKKDISIYGQEYTATTLKLSKMNLAIRGISANFGKKATSTLTDDQHPDLKADYSLMNPPFNQKDWRSTGEHEDDPRWKGYDVPPVSNANYAWILNMVSKLSVNGTGCLILANGALSSDDAELRIRKQLLLNDLVEAIIVLPVRMFYTTDISVTIWVFNKNKTRRPGVINDQGIVFRDRRNEILFMDLRRKGHPYEKKYIEFTKEDRDEFSRTFHEWQIEGGAYKNIKEYCYSATIKEVLNKNSDLKTSIYIEFDKNNDEHDFDLELQEISSTLKVLKEEDEDSFDELAKVMEKMGYDIKPSKTR